MKYIVFFKFIFLSLLTTLIVTGCGAYHGEAFEVTKNKQKCFNFANKHMKNSDFCLKTKEYDLVNIYARSGNSLIESERYNKSNAAGLQVAAETTLAKKHNFFAIVYPPKLSTFDGSLVSTPEEFLKKCDVGLKNIYTFSLDPCSIHYHPRGVNLIIATFEQKPLKALVFDAKEVLKYLKDNDRYDKDSTLDTYKKRYPL